MSFGSPVTIKSDKSIADESQALCRFSQYSGPDPESSPGSNMAAESLRPNRLVVPR